VFEFLSAWQLLQSRRITQTLQRQLDVRLSIWQQRPDDFPIGADDTDGLPSIH
jgi:hypothetical protein